LYQAGQSIWLEDASRGLLEPGGLDRYIDEGAVTGLTSNPAIFAGAIATGGMYDLQARVLAECGLRGEELFVELVVEDFRRAAQLLQPLWDATGGRDGWVSLEVSPRLAYDAPSTVAEAQGLYQKADIPNLLVKVPGTPEGLTAIEELVFIGVPIDVTLLFSDQQYLAAAGAYQRALERRREAGVDLAVGSMASLVVPRWEYSCMERIPEQLKDELGPAMAARAHRAYRSVLASSRWQELAAAGARPQRLRFAGAGAGHGAGCNPSLLERLGAPDTVVAIPRAALEDRFAQGRIGRMTSLEAQGGDQALARLVGLGFDPPRLASRLQEEAAEAFIECWENLMQTLESKSPVPAGGGA
ncbi:MAG: transaldolase, partial [Candidatus Dormibacteraeota bacterium]|nr:transaldolase [Candidatus Dormibacteraeota bacterium]